MPFCTKILETEVHPTGVRWSGSGTKFANIHEVCKLRNDQAPKSMMGISLLSIQDQLTPVVKG